MADEGFMASGATATDGRTITVLSGEVDDANLQRVCLLIADAKDQVIGLKLRFNPPVTDRWSVEIQSVGDGYIFDGEIELIVSGGANWINGALALDGFWLVKYGGMHQGVLSFGLHPVDEAQIRLNIGVRLAHKAI